MIIKNISGLIFHTQPQPVCKPISNELFTLIGNHSYTGLFKNKKDKSFYFFKITIPNGYRWDKRTIPKIFRCLRSKDGLVELSALLHDFLYETKGGKNIIFGELKFYRLDLELLKKTRLFNVYFSLFEFSFKNGFYYMLAGSGRDGCLNQNQGIGTDVLTQHLHCALKSACIAIALCRISKNRLGRIQLNVHDDYIG